jgi:hypothetical protein
MKLGIVLLSNFSVNNVSLLTKSVKHDKLSKVVPDSVKSLAFVGFLFCPRLFFWPYLTAVIALLL